MIARETDMLEDFRGHDPNPTVHERAWMEANPYPVVFRVAVLAAVAVVVGLNVSGEAVTPAQAGTRSVAALGPLDE
jgi:hypothetical protein